MKPPLYLETTIPSYLVARRSRDLRLAADQETTEEWWETQRQNYDLYISQFVCTEVERGDSRAAAERVALLQGVPVLPELDAARHLADALVAAGLIPSQAPLDAAHIATATVHAMDYLLTWNCKHIHNVATLRHIERLCERLGYNCPIICLHAG
jgi:hypothetical protein